MGNNRKLRVLIDEAQSMCADLDLSLGGLEPGEAQSFDNDFSEPLVICEGLIKMCREIMQKGS